MNVLITGGAGYIGSHTLLELLQKGHSVSVLDHLVKDKTDILNTVESIAGKFEILKADLRDKTELAHVLSGKTFDCVIHFAAFIEVGMSTKDPAGFIENNVNGTQNLLQALEKINVKNVVFSSSAAVYGTPESTPIPETAKPNPENPYGLTKYLAEEILKCYSEFSGFNAISLRYFNPAGSFEGKIGERHFPETHLIPRLLRHIIDKSHKFAIYGNDYDTPDGTAIRDYIHILDLAEAHVKTVEYLQGFKGYDVFNVGTGEGYSVAQIIEAARKITGKSFSVDTHPRRQGDSPKLIANPAKIANVLGWKAKYSLEDIISSAWEWEQVRPVSDYLN